MKNRVTNTAAEAEINPALTLLKTMGPGGIERSEAAGQADLVESDVLPGEMKSYFVGNEQRPARPLLESWGFVFADQPVDGDPLFREAKLPAGWKKVATDHAMWSKILDDKGRERCAIFYKAAFYDRKATLNVTPRYVANVEYEDEANQPLAGPVRGVVKDGEAVLFTGPWHTTTDEDIAQRQSYGAYGRAQDEARDWIKANLPADLADQWAMP